ncbi:PQQ-binding-like beta-propeller repeat protein [Streptomyces sp. NPDC091416]|uniref:outer membrane protein assembly factor BamB family protein n=1 Tax=Streptomyces sp. NPDC091416 TaxID=3366003 RepID=UPI0038306DBE
MLAVTALAACGGGGSSDANPSGTRAEPSRAAAGKPARPAFDPPVRFDGPTVELTDAQQPSTTSGEALRPALALADGVAYLTTEDGLEAVDTGTGDARWNVETRNPADRGGFGSKRVAPWVSADGRTAYAAFGREVEGEGTMPDRSVIEVLAVDTATGHKTWSAQIPSAPSSTGLAAVPIGADENLAPQVVGVDAGTAVVTEADTTYAVETATGAVRWKKADFRALTFADGVVAGGESTGYAEGRLLGVDADTGRQRWSEPDVRQPAVAGARWLSGNLDDRTVVVDAVGGRTRASFEGRDWRCLDDEQSLMACSRSGYKASDTGLVVFDAKSAQQKWVLPDHSGRVVPRVTGFWHGALYGEVGGEPVVLDGNTGKDRQTSAGAAPYEIDRYGGVEGTSFHRAAG